MKLVLKYGGEVLNDSDQIKKICTNILQLSKENQLIIVCSALSKITDNLIFISKSIEKQDHDSVKNILSEIISRHKEIINNLIQNDQNKDTALNLLETGFNELRDLLNGLLLLGELTPRSFDHLLSFGERFSSGLLSTILLDMGLHCIALTGKEVGIVTDSDFGQARILVDTTKLRVTSTVDKLFSNGTIPVIGGFSGADQHGSITTTGRGGSDYTATIISFCVDADEVWLLSDIDGMMSADPNIVDDAVVIRKLSFSEAIEMALFGAKQIHPRAFEPMLDGDIPIRIRNGFNIKDQGTLITKTIESTKPAKCVFAIRHCCLIDVVGWGMVNELGTAAKIFTILAQAGVNIMMISQNPSESSISIMVKEEDVPKAMHSLEMNLLGKLFKKLELTTDVSVVALIGSGMRGTVGVASKVFGTTTKNNINIIMITQGSSELNISFAIKDEDHKTVIKALHDEFNLSQA